MLSTVFDIYSNAEMNILPKYSATLKSTMQYLSPSLPMNFDRSLIPQDICEKEYTQMSKCRSSLIGRFKQTQICSSYIVRFTECRIRRDTILYDRIKNWEIQKYKSLNLQNKQLYMQGLKFKLERLRQEFQSTPSLSTTELLQKKIAHEQAQVRWRMRYLQKLG